MQVDWCAWGEEAFAKAKQEDKPIFLSIGYSTCHCELLPSMLKQVLLLLGAFTWFQGCGLRATGCHVMERESFNNKEIAKLMNTYFVNIKVWHTMIICDA